MVMSSIGAMFAPHHQDVADEMVRVCRRGGTIGMLNWTPEGMIGALFKTMGPFAPAPPPGAQPPPLWGGEEHVKELFGERIDFRSTLEREILEITAFEHPHDYGEHFKAKYGPTIAARKNASQKTDGRENWTTLSIVSATSGISVRGGMLASSRNIWSSSAHGPDALPLI